MNPRVNSLKVCPLVSIVDFHGMGSFPCENEAYWGHIA